MELNSAQLRLLQRASRKTIRCERKKQIKIVEYLITNKLIDFSIKKTDKGCAYLVTTNEHGKAVLYEKSTVERRANVAIVLSVIAIVISFLTAFTPFSDWSKEWIESLIQSLLSQQT